MFLWRRPTDAFIQRQLQCRVDAPFTYPQPNITAQRHPPAGFDLDRYGVTLGRGREVFDRACRACARFAMYPPSFTAVHLLAPFERPEPGMVFGTVAHHLGFWSLHPCRVIEVFDDQGDFGRRWGFYFGTLPGHGERGEERFTICHTNDGQVRYEVTAMSQPGQLMTRVGYPIARALQRRFSREGRAAMLAACLE